ncbi:MAG: ATP synthase F1 subunit epsilon [Candidatus Komeilibacteria bacterium RIFCSPLOWO2_02_FULL_48_11]|uniref:ATP synthase epsilon chain n=1 Tax=Candidatus Komeilibacteria bacterium RIFCSPLOWO2_02_FULL_48_11 TaxID=1798553 RepID=A0A1G2BSI4_9BACT|nr:MAG: ATP synthase F1 subunit epsilon [Candidatus Komeilibacteria bacterium RIFCSPLOWO2_02_FULL_48_11]
MSDKISFKIITPERVIFEDQVDQVSLPTPDGEITVLPDHIPLVSVLQSGELRCKKGNTEYSLAVSGGFCEVRPDNSLSVLADTAERAEEIDIVRAEEAHQRALKLMAEARDKESVDYAALQAKLEKEFARLRVGNRYRKLPR